MNWIVIIGIILLILGFVLAAVEMAIPGFGAPGICAAVCLIAGIFCTTVSLVEGAFMTLIILAVMLAVILWLLAKGKLKSSLILKEEQKKEQGYISSADLQFLLGKKGKAANVRVSIFNMVGMRLRRVAPSAIVLPLIKARKAGLEMSANQLEAHFLAGGHVDNVVNALIASERAGIELPFEKAAAIDLAGRDVLDAVRMSVNPKVIETANISAVAKDGIELLVKARVTVRANLERLVGGAGEATILARIGEGIVTTVGSAGSHKEVLENPDDISRLVLSKGLDSGTAFEILSIDIADIDVGRNIGAQLQTLQAEADKNIAQAKAEERRAMAVAREQEMRAYVVEAEAEVPKAMAQALRDGNMGVMDYYQMQNVKADTRMREALGNGGHIGVNLNAKESDPIER